MESVLRAAWRLLTDASEVAKFAARVSHSASDGVFCVCPSLGDVRSLGAALWRASFDSEAGLRAPVGLRTGGWLVGPATLLSLAAVLLLLTLFDQVFNFRRNAQALAHDGTPVKKRSAMTNDHTKVGR